MVILISLPKSARLFIFAFYFVYWIRSEGLSWHSIRLWILWMQTICGCCTRKKMNNSATQKSFSDHTRLRCSPVLLMCEYLEVFFFWKNPQTTKLFQNEKWTKRCGMSAEGYSQYLYSNFAPSTMHKRSGILNSNSEYGKLCTWRIFETETYCQKPEHLNDGESLINIRTRSLRPYANSANFKVQTHHKSNTLMDLVPNGSPSNLISCCIFVWNSNPKRKYSTFILFQSEWFSLFSMEWRPWCVIEPGCTKRSIW